MPIQHTAISSGNDSNCVSSDSNSSDSGSDDSSLDDEDSNSSSDGESDESSSDEDSNSSSDGKSDIDSDSGSDDSSLDDKDYLIKYELTLPFGPQITCYARCSQYDFFKCIFRSLDWKSYLVSSQVEVYSCAQQLRIGAANHLEMCS